MKITQQLNIYLLRGTAQTLIVNLLTLELMFETCATFRPASTGLDHPLKQVEETLHMFQKSAPKYVNLLSIFILVAMNNIFQHCQQFT